MSAPALAVETGPEMPTRDRAFDEWADRGLAWLPEEGMGRYPVDPRDEPYDADYFRKYQEYAETELGRTLLEERLALVDLYHDGDVVDVGVGCGVFVESRNMRGGRTWGFDVNPVAVTWLNRRQYFRDPYSYFVPAVTLWDSLEHLAQPAALLARVQEWVFASLPIFRDLEHLLGSRHYRKDEHRWYWTAEGLRAWMREQGFKCVLQDDVETRLGRADIGTFVFRRT